MYPCSTSTASRAPPSSSGTPGTELLELPSIPGSAPGSHPGSVPDLILARVASNRTCNCPVPGSGSMFLHGNKVKITTKDGKLVDLEKEIGILYFWNLVGFSDPSCLPQQHRRPVFTNLHLFLQRLLLRLPLVLLHQPLQAQLQPSICCLVPAKLSIAEEFRRKILERASRPEGEGIEGEGKRKSLRPPH